MLAIAGGVYYEFRPADASSDALRTPVPGKSQAAKPNSTPSATTSKTPSANTSDDSKAKLEAARQYTERKEYQTAEDLYKQVVQVEPNNVEALKGLASVLFREDKIEESTAVLDRIPKN